MICVDQESGERRARTMAALADYRGPKMPFGVYLKPTPATLSDTRLTPAGTLADPPAAHWIETGQSVRLET